MGSESQGIRKCMEMHYQRLRFGTGERRSSPLLASPEWKVHST